MEIQRDVDKLRRIFVATNWNAHKDCGHGNGDDNIVHDNYHEHWQAPEAGGCATGDGGDRETGNIWETGDTGDTWERGGHRADLVNSFETLDQAIKPKMEDQ